MALVQIIPGIPQVIDTGDDNGFPDYRQAFYNSGGRKPIWVFGAPQANRLEIGFLNLSSNADIGTFLNLQEITDTSANPNLDLSVGNWISVGGVFAQIEAINYYDADGTDDNDQTVSIDIHNRSGNYNSIHMSYNPIYILAGDPR